MTANNLVIYINGELIETDSNTVIAYNFQINNIAQLEKRSNSYTSSFRIPKTPGNKRKFNWLGQPGNMSNSPYELLSTVIIDGSIHIKDGYSIIEQGGLNHWTLRVIYGLIDLKATIDGKYINELDWNSENFVFDESSPIDLLASEEIAIPISDTNESIISDDEVYSQRLIPCVYYKHLWNKIFQEAGFTYESNFIDTDTLLNSSAIVAGGRIERNEFSEARKEDLGVIYNSVTDPIPFEEIRSIFPLTALSNISFDGTDTLTIQSDGLFQIKFAIQSDGLTGGGTLDVQFWLNVNGVQTIELKEFLNISSGSTETMTIETFSVQLNEGDEVELVSVVTGKTGSDTFVRADFLNLIFIVENINSTIVEGETFDFSVFLPKVEQYDFIAAVMQQFGLIPIPVSLKKLKFVRIEDLLNGEFGFEDWTSKLHEEDIESYTLGDYGKINNLQYEYDTDLKQDGFADGSFELNIWRLPDNKTLFKSIFLGSFEENIVGGQEVSKLEIFETVSVDDGLGETIQQVIYKGKEKAYCISIEEHDAPSTVTFRGVLSGSTDTGQLGLKFAKSIPLHWDNLIEEHYQKLIEINQKPIVKEVLLNLNVIDINNLDLSKLVYFSQMQSFFYINKITNWQKGKLCKAEIVKVK